MLRRGTYSISGGALIYGAELIGDAMPKQGRAPRNPNLPRNVKAVRVGDEDLLLTRGERKRVLRKLMTLKAQRGEIEV